MSEGVNNCKHDWLTPEDNRTTCKKCGSDGFVCEDMEAENIINYQGTIMKNQLAKITSLEEKLKIAEKALEFYKDKKNICDDGTTGVTYYELNDGRWNDWGTKAQLALEEPKK